MVVGVLYGFEIDDVNQNLWSRLPSIGDSVDSPDATFERHLIEDATKVTQNGERGIKFHESNGIVEQTYSPKRRDVVNRYINPNHVSFLS